MFCRFYINFIFVYKMEKTLEEILLEQLDQPVRLKNGSVAENPRTGEPLMPEEAICMSIVQKAMKPVRLFGLQIQNSSKKGDIVLDSFGGSGTTVIACEQLGRKARLMEYDPHYCDVIIARWEKFTQGNAWRV